MLVTCASGPSARARRLFPITIDVRHANLEGALMSLLIPSSLLVQAGDNKAAQRFILASSDWFDLQTRVHALSALPGEMDEFEERYGPSVRELDMDDAFFAMHNLRRSALGYGNPQVLRANILNHPDYLERLPRPSNNLFLTTAWSLQRARQDAQALAAAFSAIATMGAQGDAAESAARIKAMFLDDQQLLDRMQQTVDQFDRLIAEWDAIERDLETAQRLMKNFTERNSKTRSGLDMEIGKMRVVIAQFERTRGIAYQKWLALTVATSVAPTVIGIVGVAQMVILAAPPGGVSFAIGAASNDVEEVTRASALGLAAGAARASYVKLVKQVESKEQYLNRRICYRTELGALDQLIKLSLPSSRSVASQIALVRHAWAGTVREFGARLTDLNGANVHTGPWSVTEDMRATASGWRSLDAAILAFFKGALIDAAPIDFGSTMPPDHGDWESTFAQRRSL
jgi:hypothetical protein